MTVQKNLGKARNVVYGNIPPIDLTDWWYHTAEATYKLYNGSTWVAFNNKSFVGLGNVDNTSDADKPVSTAQATAIAIAKGEAISEASIGATATASAAQEAAQNYSDATKQPIFLSVPIGAANAYVGELADMICGENIYEGELCTPATNGRMYKSNASGVNMPATYIATQDGVMGSCIAFLKRGKVRNKNLGLSIGGTVYVSATAKPTTTRPTGGQTIQLIGRSISETTFDFEPGLWSSEASIHNDLSGRSDADAHPATSTSVVTPSGFTALNQQALDDEYATEINNLKAQIAANQLTFAAIYGYNNLI